MGWNNYLRDRQQWEGDLQANRLFTNSLGVYTTTPRGLFDINNLVSIGNISSGNLSVNTTTGTRNFNQANERMLNFSVYAFKNIFGTTIFSETSLDLFYEESGFDDYSIVLSWSAVAGADGYRVVVVNDDYYERYGNAYKDTTSLSMNYADNNEFTFTESVPTLTPSIIGSSFYVAETGDVNIINADVLASKNMAVGSSTIDIGRLNVVRTSTDAGGTTPHIYMVNSSSVGQTILSAKIGANVVTKWRSDYTGGINWVAGYGVTNGFHVFYVGGDFGTGNGKLAAKTTGILIGHSVTQLNTSSAYLHLSAGSSTAGRAPLKFDSGTLLSTQEAGSVEYDGNRLFHTNSTALREAISGVIFLQTADKTISNTTTETSMFGTGSGTITLPANFFNAGKSIRFRLRGHISNTGTPNIEVKAKLGSTELITTTAKSTASGLSNNYFVVEVVISCRTTGASGTIVAAGSLDYDSGSNKSESFGMVKTTTTTINTTTSQALDCTLTWGTANVLNTITTQVGVVETIY